MRKFTARFTKTDEAKAFAAHIVGPGWHTTEIVQKGRTVTWLSDSTEPQYLSDMQETVHHFGSPEFMYLRTKSNSSWITQVEDVEEIEGTPVADTSKLTGQALKDANWVLTFAPGSEWRTGAFRPNRETELVWAGVLLPTGVDGVFTVGSRAGDAPAEPATDLGSQGARETFGETDDTDGSDAPTPTEPAPAAPGDLFFENITIRRGGDGPHYPHIETHTWQEFAGLAIEMGGYCDMTAVNPYTGDRMHLAWVFGQPAPDRAVPEDKADIYTALRRLIDAMEQVDFLGERQLTKLDEPAKPDEPAHVCVYDWNVLPGQGYCRICKGTTPTPTTTTPVSAGDLNISETRGDRSMEGDVRPIVTHNHFRDLRCTPTCPRWGY